MTRMALLFLGVVLPVLIAVMLLTVWLTHLSDDEVDLQPVGIPGFDVCSLPCWAGVMIGETGMDQADVLLTTHLPESATYTRLSTIQSTFQIEQSDVYEITSGSIFGIDSSGQVLVDQIVISVAYPMWRLFEQLGVPSCARGIADNTNDILTLYWEREGFTLIATILPDRMRPWQQDSRTTNLWMLTTGDICESANAAAWHGFAPLWYYTGR